MASLFDSMVSLMDDIIQDTFGETVEIWDGLELYPVDVVKTSFEGRVETQGDLSIYRASSEFVQFPKSELPGVSYENLEVEYDEVRYKVADYEIGAGFVTLFLVKK